MTVLENTQLADKVFEDALNLPENDRLLLAARLINTVTESRGQTPEKRGSFLERRGRWSDVSLTDEDVERTLEDERLRKHEDAPAS